MKPMAWIETDYKGVQWRVQRVTGKIARILTGRNSYLAYTRLTTASTVTAAPVDSAASNVDRRGGVTPPCHSDN